MRSVILLVLALAVSCSNSSTKNGDPNGDPNNVADGGGDVSGNNSTSDAALDSSPNSDVGGSDSSLDVSTGSDDGVSSDIGTADASADMSMLPSPCPTDPPAAASACTADGLQCEYGTDPRESCRIRALCTGGNWGITAPRCEALPPVTCPATRADASGELCDPIDAYCEYNDGFVCHCTNCVDGPVIQCQGDPTWMCPAPNPDATCPPAKPRLGDGCANDRKVCNYKCGADGGRTCTGGSWQQSDGGPCPISTVKVKRDIRYLSPGELAEISAAVQAIPLARWQYTDPALGRGDKLGFIIEDLPSATPAVDRDRLMVDLYGYTSMLVADAQAREQRMRVLEGRLLELEKQALQCGQ